MKSVQHIHITPMREAFFQAFQRQKHELDPQFKSVIARKLKGNAGRVFHKKGWFVTRRKK